MNVTLINRGLTETKLDESYPTSQFKMNGFETAYRLDRNTHGGVVMIYIREHLPCKLIQFSNKPNDIQGIFFELALRKNKWLLVGGYNPAKELISYFLDHVSKNLDITMSNYDNILILGDLNCTASDVPMKNFCELYNLENLMKKATCFINVALTNSPDSFHNSIAIETGFLNIKTKKP